MSDAVDLRINKNWGRHEFTWRRAVSDRYNSEWISSRQLNYAEPKSLSQIDGIVGDTVGCNDYQVVWLKNIDRLMDMLPESISPANYHLLDLGCGAGISTLYFHDVYPFQSTMGVDFSKELIDKAWENLSIYAAKFKGQSGQIKFHCADVRVFSLSLDTQFIIFIYNPFEFDIMEIFIKNNLEALQENNCIIIYANDVHIEKLISLSLFKYVKRCSVNNLSVLEFK